jgi:hypothetical protein
MRAKRGAAWLLQSVDGKKADCETQGKAGGPTAVYSVLFAQ